MIRVLQIGMTDNLGGIETFLMNYYRNIDKEKIQFDFINMSNNKVCFQDEIEQLGGKIYKVPSEFKHPISCYRELIKIIKENNYDIIHINKNSVASVVVLKAVKDSGAKTRILHSHKDRKSVV